VPLGQGVECKQLIAGRELAGQNLLRDDRRDRLERQSGAGDVRLPGQQLSDLRRVFLRPRPAVDSAVAQLGAQGFEDVGIHGAGPEPADARADVVLRVPRAHQVCARADVDISR